MSKQLFLALLIPLLFLVQSFSALAQEKDYAKLDSLKEARQIARAEKYKNLKPSTAAWLSLALPGAGQVYNRSYWKVPLVYGGLATFAILANFNQNEYIRYKRAYNDATDDFEETQVPDDLRRLTNNALRANRNDTKRYRDLNIILGVLFYGIQIADAYTDAHLKAFEVGDKISMEVNPDLFYTNGNRISGGLTLRMSLK